MKRYRLIIDDISTCSQCGARWMGVLYRDADEWVEKHNCKEKDIDKLARYQQNSPAYLKAYETAMIDAIDAAADSAMDKWTSSSPSWMKIPHEIAMHKMVMCDDIKFDRSDVSDAIAYTTRLLEASGIKNPEQYIKKENEQMSLYKAVVSEKVGESEDGYSILEVRKTIPAIQSLDNRDGVIQKVTIDFARENPDIEAENIRVVVKEW